MLQATRSACISLFLLAGCATTGHEQQVIVTDSVSLAVADGRQLPLRVVYRPDARARAVIVLSHGTFSSGKRYDAVALPWAEQGYAVILPSHRDADRAEIPRSVAGMLDIVRSRVEDLRAVATQLPDIESRLDAAPLTGAPLVAAGHSVGAQVALQVAGLRVRDPRDGSMLGWQEERFTAVILLSDPGKMAMMPDDTWRGAARPVFMVTGSDDYGLMGDGRRAADFENEVVLPVVEPARYLLRIDGLDHQFGGLIHKRADTPPDTEALRWTLDTANDFLAFCVSGLRQSGPQTGRISARAELLVSGASCRPD